MTKPTEQGSIQFCRGRVMHARSRPCPNRFVYPVFFLRLRLTDTAGLRAASGPWFGYQRAGLLSFHDRDHGGRDGGDLLAWLDGRLAAAGLQRPDGDVWLQTFPRLMGYAFKPVSFWFCHERSGALTLLLAEVNNTFGERHQYVLVPPNGGVIDNDTLLSCSKVFHVSPFCEVKGSYRFRIRRHGDLHMAGIDYYDDQNQARPLLKTALWGRAEPLRAGRILTTVLAMPFMTLGVVARIHWQALRLWGKGVPFFRKPAAPEREVTHNIEVIR